MCTILHLSIKTNPKISSGLGGIYFRVINFITVNYCWSEFITIFGDTPFETFSN